MAELQPIPTELNYEYWLQAKYNAELEVIYCEAMLAKIALKGVNKC